MIFSNAMLHWLKSYEKLTSFFMSCSFILSDYGYGACHFSLKDNALVAKQFLQKHLCEYLEDSSIIISSPEYDYEKVKKIIDDYFFIVYENSIYESPFIDDVILNFDWMTKSQPIAHYLKTANDLSKFIKYLRCKWDDTPIEVISSQCEFIFKQRTD